MHTTTHTGLGITITHTYSNQDDEPYVNRMKYEHGNRRVTLNIHGSQLPAEWRVRAHVSADYYENGRRIGNTKTYNILENAQIKATRYCLGLNSDSKAAQAIGEMRLQHRREFTQRRDSLLNGLNPDWCMLREWAKTDFNIMNLDNPDDEPRIMAFINDYATDTEAAAYDKACKSEQSLGCLILDESKTQGIDYMKHPRYKEMLHLVDETCRMRERIHERMKKRLAENIKEAA